MSINDIKKSIEEVESNISKLTEKRAKLNEELLNLIRAKELAAATEWRLVDNPYIICFAKDKSSYYLIKTFAVKGVENDLYRFSAVEGCYSLFEFEFCYSIHNKTIPFSELINLTKDYNIYVVDAVMMTAIQQHLCELDVDYNNIDSYISKVEQNNKFIVKGETNGGNVNR